MNTITVCFGGNYNYYVYIIIVIIAIDSDNFLSLASRLCLHMDDDDDDSRDVGHARLRRRTYSGYAATPRPVTAIGSRSR